MFCVSCIVSGSTIVVSFVCVCVCVCVCACVRACVGGWVVCGCGCFFSFFLDHFFPFPFSSFFHKSLKCRVKKYETYIASFCAVQSPTICMLPLTGISFNIVDFYVPVFAKNAKCGMLEQLNPQV